MTDLDILFTYHAPTEATTPKYATIRLAEIEAAGNLDYVAAWFAGGEDESGGDDRHAMHNHVNVGTKLYAEAVLDVAPAGADRDAAILAIRLARNAANEGIATGNIGRLFAMARTKLQEARWLANGAVANGAATS